MEHSQAEMVANYEGEVQGLEDFSVDTKAWWARTPQGAAMA